MSALSDWVDDQKEVAFFTGGLLATFGTNVLFKHFNTTKLTFAGSILGAYVGTQAVGYVASGAIDGRRGIDNWMTASHTMFRNRTVLDDVPVVGTALTIIPNPIGIIEVLFRSGMLIGEEFGGRGFIVGH